MSNILRGERIGPWLPEKQRLLEFLSTEYAGELEMGRRLRQHAQRMHYPQFRERLTKIATEEQKHAQWLCGKIVALGGVPPEIPATVYTGKNSWECLVSDLEEECRCSADLEDGLVRLQTMDAEIAQGLRRIQEDETIHRDEIRKMLMRSDAYALWPE